MDDSSVYNRSITKGPIYVNFGSNESYGILTVNNRSKYTYEQLDYTGKRIDYFIGRSQYREKKVKYKDNKLIGIGRAHV